MLTTVVPIHAPLVLLTSPTSSRSIHKLSTVTAFWRMSMNSGSFQTKKREELSLPIQHPAAFDPKGDDTPKLPDLRFDRLQIPEQDLVDVDKMEFRQFFAREALIALILVNLMLSNDSNLASSGINKDSTELSIYWLYFLNWWQEFLDIRRRSIGPFGQQFKCIITVRASFVLSSEKARRDGETHNTEECGWDFGLEHPLVAAWRDLPWVYGKAPHLGNIHRGGEDIYGYVSNLVVAEFARRRGIATNMMQFAIETTKSNGVELLYVHVDRNNRPALQLYEKMGFEMIEEASEGRVEDNTYLLRSIL
ncbi:unnamed protein product [Linum tenue]|uniref:N-acetyltransferase domain-containing protein n=1 Tax=Linum tenue TaxID=586396 RepID=A0AAV0HIY5_9ROSI|nr:unnamed protein product [Linum tenue]